MQAELSKALLQIEVLQASLVAVEAERDAARERVKHCETRMMRYAMKLAEMQAERDAARAEAEARVKQNETQIRIHFQNTREWKEALEKARAGEARARWCEETKAQVSWSIVNEAWRVLWDSDTHGYRQASHADRNAAIDAAMKGGAK